MRRPILLSIVAAALLVFPSGAHSAVTVAPVSVDDFYTAGESHARRVLAGDGVLRNDFDPDGDPISAVLVSGPLSGDLSLSADGSFTYTPDPGFQGTDTFAYQASDGTDTSPAASVVIDVMPLGAYAPVGVDDIAQSLENEQNYIGVLWNDSDMDGDPLFVSDFTSPARGQLTFVGGGIFLYVPRPNYDGPDSFTYTVDDGRGGTATAVVSITVLENGFVETFNDGVANRFTPSGPAFWSVVNRRYRAAATAGAPDVFLSTYAEIYRDFAFSVEVKRLTGHPKRSHGVFFRSDGTYQNGYLFHINAEGFFYVGKRVNGGYLSLTPDWIRSAAIKRGLGVTNILGVVCQGRKLSFYINGRGVRTITDGTFRRGRIALKGFGSSRDADVVLFDNASAVLDVYPNEEIPPPDQQAAGTGP